MMLLLLTDGRFAFLCEGSYVGLSDSWVSINYKIIFASSLQMLLFFGLGDSHRGMLGIDIGGVKKQSSTVPLTLLPSRSLSRYPLAPSLSLSRSLAPSLSRFLPLAPSLATLSLPPSRSLSLSHYLSLPLAPPLSLPFPLSLVLSYLFSLFSFVFSRLALRSHYVFIQKYTYSRITKKVRESIRGVTSPEPIETFLTFPKIRFFALLKQLGLEGSHSRISPKQGEYQPDQLPSITCEDTQVLWCPLWENDEEERKRHDDKYYQEFLRVWFGCSGFPHQGLAWMNGGG